jgi:hypothetical protein
MSTTCIDLRDIVYILEREANAGCSGAAEVLRKVREYDRLLAACRFAHTSMARWLAEPEPVSWATGELVVTLTVIEEALGLTDSATTVIASLDSGVDC